MDSESGSRNNGGRPKQKGVRSNGKGRGKKGGRHSVRKVSKVDKEIKEIEKLSAKIAEYTALPDEEKPTLKKFEELPISHYTLTGRWVGEWF